MHTSTGKIRISTSFAERQNWTVRTTMRCYTPCRMAFRANWRITRLHPQVFCLQFHQASSYTSHVSGHGRWRYGSALERRGLGCPLGILRAAEGGKSGVGEVVFATVDTGQYYRVRHIIPRPRRHNMGRPWFTVLWNSLSLPRAEYATNFKVVHYVCREYTNRMGV